MKLSIVNSMIPSQRQSRQCITNPKEYGPTDWAFDPTRDPTFNRIRLPTALQSDNMFHLLEPSTRLQTAMFNQPTGEEPVYGECKYQLNPLDNGRNNLAANAMYDMTQVQWSKNVGNVIRNTTSQYSNYKGIPEYMNYSGSSAFMKR